MDKKEAKHLKNILGFNLEEPFGAPFLRKLPSLYILCYTFAFLSSAYFLQYNFNIIGFM